MANYTASGQITVAAAGTAVQGTNAGDGVYYIKALSGNAGLTYAGNDNAGDVTASNGYEFSAGDQIVYVGNLNDLWFDAASNGDKFCWIKVEK